MKKYYYKISVVSHACLEVCKVQNNGTMIGSGVCMNTCEHNAMYDATHGKDSPNAFIRCDYLNRVIPEDQIGFYVECDVIDQATSK